MESQESDTLADEVIFEDISLACTVPIGTIFYEVSVYNLKFIMAILIIINSRLVHILFFARSNDFN
jgi:hypothetical protein